MKFHFNHKFIALILIFLFSSPCLEEEIVLVEGKGFGNLIIGELNNKDVVRILGEPDSIEETPKEWSRNYIYSKLGLIINFHNDTLNTIRTLPNFNGKTSNGITLNSSLEDIEEAYGEPNVAPYRTKDNAETWSYDEGVIFWLKRSRYLKRFKGIDKIVIYNNSWRWKEKKK
ncbi:MAG: hypothetical protein GY936_20315 [Ignavibacteriae bacterium]|nr:hypothetical protein [Ignavibacteriota bacterium]